MAIIDIAGGVALGLLVFMFLPELLRLFYWIAPLVILAFIAIVALNG